METNVAEVAETKVAGKLSWKDFPMEDHLRGYMGVPANCLMVSKKIYGRVYRVNVIDTKAPAEGRNPFIKSVMVKIIESPEGWIFQEV